MKTLSEILNNIRKESLSEQDKGFRFERLMQAYLRTSSIYEGIFDNVWLWQDFPYKDQFGGKDTGIDLVAKTEEGSYWAIQCKCYAEDKYIAKPDVDTFLSTSGKSFDTDQGSIHFSQRLWISTTNKWNSTAELSIKNQTPPVTRLNLIELESDNVDWEKLEQGLYGKTSRPAPFTILEHQKKAIEKTHEYFKNHERGKLIMACGSGKTFTSLKIAENETNNNGLVLFLVPSIALLGQTLRSWCQQASKPIHAVCICSDSQVSKQEIKNDDSSTSVLDLALPASTDTDFIVKQLQYMHQVKKDGMKVVFSTYQSIAVIAQAQKELLRCTSNEFGIFDLIICDEAHRTTGVTLKGEDESSFVKVHDNTFLQAKHRIYMTATPRIYVGDTKKKAEENEAVLCSMDDTNIYGEEIYKIGFGEAVEKELLTDYKVLILAVGDKDITPSLRDALTNEDGTIPVDDAAKFVGCINALSKKVLGDEGLIKAADPSPMQRAVAFCSTIKASKLTAKVFTDCKDSYMEDISDKEKAEMVDVVAHHVDGTMSATMRDNELMWLKAQPENNMECRMLTNARCLSEGVDVPSLDAVVFVSPKNSQVDVVQSVGRVMRRSKGKKYGYIIIPVVVPENLEGDKVLEKHPNFKVVWTVLNALRAHDDRFNAEVNTIELSKKQPKHILFGGVAPHDDDRIDHGDGHGADGKKHENENSAAVNMAKELSLKFEDLQNVFYAKMVTKVGTKRYWELWAKDIAKIADEHIEHIKKLIAQGGKHREAFDILMRGLHSNINPNLTEQEAIEMLSQHIIARPVFEALFGDFEFTANNAISQSMQKMLDTLDDEVKTEEEHERLQKFYDYVRTTVGDIQDAEGRQRLIVELYDKFFKVASPKTVEKLGIVYTPVEVVDYILRSVNYIIQREFGRSISDENVNILDPFTGTGTFITRLLQNGLISKDAFTRKYKQEIHANEIVLMAYYIASINIESVYHSLMQEDQYTSFDGICLTDTFQLGEDQDDGEKSREGYGDVFPMNSKRVSNQRKKPITIIIGNPPYSVGQKSANDNAQNLHYPVLDKRIEETYARMTQANNKNSLYDSYIKAFRWASDRLDKNGGVIGFVTNGNWLDGNSQDGMRKCLEQEFSTIYIFNLRGNQRTSGELSRKEGGKIFGSGSRTPIAITILVKKPKKDANEKAKIFYHDIGDYLSREKKLEIIKDMGDISNPSMMWRKIKPNEHGDWINKRNEMFKLFTALGDKERASGLKKPEDQETFFVPYYSCGIKTARDGWCYNFNQSVLEQKMQMSIDFYNEQRIAFAKEKENSQVDVKSFVTYDDHKVSWNRGLLNYCNRNKAIEFDKESVRVGMYRPFTKQWCYYNIAMNDMTYQIDKLFPTSKTENLILCTTSAGDNNFSVYVTKNIPDLHLIGTSQCFPLYWYEDQKNKDSQDLFTQALSEEERYIRHDGITNWILKTARKQYGKNVQKEDIFYYVYGLLHSPDYRKTFATDLKKSLPRLPLVDKAEDFWAFSKAGRELAELHLNYETIEPYSYCNIKSDAFTNEGDFKTYRVQKMRFGKKDNKTADKSVIIYNSAITINGIPEKAYEYVVNGKSAIEWLMERYAITTDSKSGITNDPNDWAKEQGDEKYILNLLLRIINLSLKSVEIIESLPKLNFEV